VHAHHASWLTLVVVSTGCVGQPPPAPSHGDVGTTTSGGSSSTGVAPSDGTSSEGMAVDATTSDTTGGGTTTDDASSSSETTEGPAPPTARSCVEILELDPSVPTGVHEILNELDGTVIDVYCEMDLDGGGWTLVARTAPGAEGPFGWGVERGMLGDEAEPYSLGALDLGLQFTEILVTQRSGFAMPVENAYRIEVPSGFLEDYRDAAYNSVGATTVLGDCAPSFGPDILRWLGYTEDEEKYFIRDFSGNHPYGLWPNGLRLFYDNCDQGGNLNDEQGALFVR
jgi:hypothetical protein